MNIHRPLFTLLFTLTMTLPLISIAMISNQINKTGVEKVPALCEDTDCTQAMITIEKDFHSLKNAPEISEDPRVYSGDCHMMGFGTDPMDRQFGIALLESKNKQPTFSGLFSFANVQNPFEKMSLDEVRQTLKISGSQPKDVMLMQDTAKVEFLTSGSQIEYWMRQNTETNDVYLLSRWLFANNHEVIQAFCHFKKHSF